MVLGLPAFPMIALGGYLGYKAWPYLSESKRDIPKEAASDALDFLGDSIESLVGIGVSVVITYAIVFTGYVIWTGTTGFWPTVLKFFATEALIVAGAMGLEVLAQSLYRSDYISMSPTDVSGLTFFSTNAVLIPIVVSKLFLEATDNREMATAAGIITLAATAITFGQASAENDWWGLV